MGENGINEWRISYSKIAGILIVVLLFILIVASGVRSMAIVEGQSMEPLFHTGDVVFLKKKGPGEIKVGDIVVYEAKPGKYIIHRVISIYQAAGTTCYVVKGDNNPIPDPGLPPCPYKNGVRGIPYEAISGVVLAPDGIAIKIPYLGGLTLLFRG
ncbi:MAG: signal peptidase I [Desulfurococcales archaeon]|nr:signal peptidase I [Desulfurococcales archaeon]